MALARKVDLITDRLSDLEGSGIGAVPSHT